jgi:hypothetical protein
MGNNPTNRPRLLDQLSIVCQRRHFSPGQKRLTGSGSANSFSSNKRHPRGMGPSG